MLRPADYGFILASKSKFLANAPEGVQRRAEELAIGYGGYSWVIWEPDDPLDGYLLTGDSPEGVLREFQDFCPDPEPRRPIGWQIWHGDESCYDGRPSFEVLSRRVAERELFEAMCLHGPDDLELLAIYPGDVEDFTLIDDQPEPQGPEGNGHDLPTCRAPGTDDHEDCTECSGDTLDDLLERVSVMAPGMWENDQGPEGWFAVCTDGGIVAYFASERDAFRDRLDRINRALNG